MKRGGWVFLNSLRVRKEFLKTGGPPLVTGLRPKVSYRPTRTVPAYGIKQLMYPLVPNLGILLVSVFIFLIGFILMISLRSISFSSKRMAASCSAEERIRPGPVEALIWLLLQYTRFHYVVKWYYRMKKVEGGPSEIG